MGGVITYFLVLLWLAVHFAISEHIEFTLRSVLHQQTGSQNRLLQQSLPNGALIQAEDLTVRIKTRPTLIQRLVDRRPSTIEPILLAAREYGIRLSQPWVTDTVLAPDVTDRSTVINFALMAANAYTLIPGTADWEDLDAQFGLNTSLDFGWNSAGLRGHIYADASNSTVIIGIKGTSRSLFDDAETAPADKQNDNLYFSCCCAQQGPWTYTQVCDCATATYRCNSTCLAQSLRQDHRYYQAARYLYANVTTMYPNASIMVTGHSLGGAVSSLLGLTYGLPVMAFEAPGEALAAGRLGIPSPPDSEGEFAREQTGVYHFGHTADPIYMGTCNGATASCTYFGYAFESQCHAGKMCTYDTVADHSWNVGMWRHGIRGVINDVLRAYDHVPECILDDQCQDCYLWKFSDSNSSITTTSSSSSQSRTRTRTSTCETPGWWGCRDQSTTTTATTGSVTTTETSSTSTCLTPGWFWCRDKTTARLRTIGSSRPATVMASTTGDDHQPQRTKGPIIDDEL